MAEPTPATIQPTVDAPGAASPTPPDKFYRVNDLPIATELYPGDLLQIEQFVPAFGRHRSMQISYEAFRRLTHPDATHLTADHDATPMDCAFTGNASAGSFNLRLLPLAQMGCRELPVLNVGPSGSFTVRGRPGEPIVSPTGPVDSLSFRPGETARLRAVTVPEPAISGWYLVGV